MTPCSWSHLLNLSLYSSVPFATWPISAHYYPHEVYSYHEINSIFIDKQWRTELFCNDGATVQHTSLFLFFLWYILYILVCCSHATLNIYLFNLQQSSLSSCITALQRLTAVTMLKLTLRKMTLTCFDCKRLTAVFLGPIESQISWNQRKDTVTAFTVVYLGVLTGFCSYCIFFSSEKTRLNR